jgi:Fe-S cluster assembly protein SufB
MTNVADIIEREYAYGFHADLDTELAPKGLSEDVVRLISSKRNEPEWLLEWRLAAFRHFLTLAEPAWPNVHYPPIDCQDMHYWAAPKPKVLLPVLDSRLTEDEARQLFADMVAVAHPSKGDAE